MTRAYIMTRAFKPSLNRIPLRFYLRPTCLIVMKIWIRLLDDYKTYSKNFQIAPYSNYDVTTKKLNNTIQVFISKLHA